MTREEIIRNLKYTMEKHKNDTVSTFGTNISVMCKDILDYLEKEPCGDAISRQDAIRICEERGHDNSAYCMRQLPSVNPQEPKIGHWIRISTAEIYECSECGQNVMTSDICVYKFCHGCGARMVGEQESEDEEGEQPKIIKCPNCGACMKDGRTLDEFIEDSKEVRNEE